MQHTYPKTGSLMWVGDLNLRPHNLRAAALQYVRERLIEHSNHSAHLFDANNHPDFKCVEPEADKRIIKIEQIRDLIEWSATKPSIALMKFALIHPAEAMNLQAANALLKTLEEPFLDTQFLLISYQPSLVPLTIRSRCHIIRHRTNPKKYHSDLDQDPMRSIILEDLQAIKSGEKDPLVIAAAWAKKDVHQVLYWLMVVLCEFANSSTENEHLIKSKRWWRFMDEVFEAKRSLDMKTQTNTELLLESLLLQYARMTIKGAIDVRSQDAFNPFQTNFSLNH